MVDQEQVFAGFAGNTETAESHKPAVGSNNTHPFWSSVGKLNQLVNSAL